MYGSRILILGNMKKLWYMISAENPTPTWLRSQQLDSASGGTATSSSQGRVKRIPILQTLSRIPDSQRFQRNPQFFNHPPSQDKQSQAALLPVQWMPFPQYPQQSRTSGHQPESTKEFHLQDLDCKNDFSMCTKLYNSSPVRLSTSEREMLRYGSE